MRRRDLFALPAWAVLAPTLALAQSHDHHHEHASKAPAGLIAASADCALKGRICLDHCLDLIAAGDTSIIQCAKSVNELIPVCHALNALAVANSKNLSTVAKALRTVCVACEAECRKHAEKHAQCKACADSCLDCVKEIDKLA